MGIADQIKKITDRTGTEVCLVAVSKTRRVEELMEAYAAGQRVFGENKVQELTRKYLQMPPDVQWHFIGHLQTNKVKQIAHFVSLIHSVDSFKLLKSVDKEGKKYNRRIKCLLQFHIAEEETKFGLNLEEAIEILSSPEYGACDSVELCGVMGMATYTDNENQIRKEFRSLKHIFEQLKVRFFGGQDSFSEISMGMSDDYPLAVEEGSTMIRIGSLIFGERDYGSSE